MIDEPQRPDPDKLLEQAAPPIAGKLKNLFRRLRGGRQDLRHAQ